MPSIPLPPPSTTLPSHLFSLRLLLQAGLVLTPLRSWRCHDATFLERLIPSASGLVVMGFVQTDMLLWQVEQQQQLSR